MDVFSPVLWAIQNKNDGTTPQIVSSQHKTSVVDMNAIYSKHIACQEVQDSIQYLYFM